MLFVTKCLLNVGIQSSTQTCHLTCNQQNRYTINYYSTLCYECTNRTIDRQINRQTNRQTNRLDEHHVYVGLAHACPNYIEVLCI